MKQTRKTSHGSKTTTILLGAAAVLLLSSAIGSTRAALTYYSENYTAKVTVSQIGVSLVENGDIVAKRDYDGDKWNETSEALLQNMIPEGEKLVPGKSYEEELTVKNSGSIDEYVRVSIVKSWTDKDGKKETTLTPDLIELGMTNAGWIVDEKASTPERTVLYYTTPLAPGETAAPFADTLRIDNSVAERMTQTSVTDENGYTTITTTYDYDGVTFNVEAQVDAVQTHNAEDAIKSAWGVDAQISADGTLSLQ